MINILFLLFYFIVIVLHVYFVVLEMKLWTTRAPKVFGVTPEFAQQSRKLASNQGLYNGFLVVALVIGWFAPNEILSHGFIMYALLCVIAAGVWGGLTVHRQIALVQAVPALIALVLYSL